MFFYYFGLISFTAIVAITLALITVSCCKGRWVYRQIKAPKFRAYDNKLQVYNDLIEQPRWEYVKCAIKRKYHPHNDPDVTLNKGEYKHIMIADINELNTYRKKFSNYNKIMDFTKRQEQLIKDYNTFDEQQRIIE